jgi:hypothetical protein
MSNTDTDSQSYSNQNTSSTDDKKESSKQQINTNDGYTQRQLQSAFQPSTVIFLLFICLIFLNNLYLLECGTMC